MCSKARLRPTPTRTTRSTNSSSCAEPIVMVVLTTCTSSWSRRSSTTPQIRAVAQTVSLDRLTGTELPGFCYYPGGSVDGCVIKFDTLPGVMYQNLNTASTKTIVHEAGHWLGLKHPFDTPPPTGACKGTDEVDDTDEYTYAERFSSTPTSCKTGKPFNQDNWMSYAVPRSRFTQVSCVVSI